MSPAKQLHVELLRSTAADVLQDLVANEEDHRHLGTLIFLTILAIDAIAPPLSDRPMSVDLSR